MMKFWRLLMIALLLLVGVIHVARADTLDDYLRAEMKKQKIPGLSVAVIKDGTLIKVKGYGEADIDKKTPATMDTAYDVGSVSKPFTAAAVLLLVESGRISLDDSIGRFIADVPVRWRGITVRHLLTHTSGIKDYLSEMPAASQNQEFTTEELYHRAVLAGLNFAPGAKFRYSHTNYVLLGMVIESATGRPFDQFISERIFKPLEMTHTQVKSVENSVPNLATGYRLQDGTRQPAEREGRSYADAFFASTANDLAKWAVALDTGAFLSNASRNLMWTPALLADGSKSSYGIGWYTENLRGHRVIGHGGSVGGFSSNLTRFPDDHLTVLILTNLRDVNVFPLVRGVASRYAAALK